ncbi:LRR receptor-like serine/threonine-protein kinase GSO1 [Miscanthus floridulus]|uniref:LRR receptor-like serine/threonine-protein kinase GSO1 n=1 Tax=Miscanthus floridulus TaxID=154761 RepID=UPI0034588CDE
MARPFLAPLMILALVLLSCMAAAANDGDVLLLVKSTFVDDPQGVLAGWNASAGASGFCSWAGVACDEAGLRVVGLNLSGTGLAGTVPRDALEAIDLLSNALTGPVSAALGGLANLQVLLLYSNQLTARHLTVLGLASCNLTGPILASLGRLGALTALNLQQNALSGPILRGLAGLASLQVLSLAGNQLTGAIPPELERLAGL